MLSGVSNEFGGGFIFFIHNISSFQNLKQTNETSHDNSKLGKLCSTSPQADTYHPKGHFT